MFFIPIVFVVVIVKNLLNVTAVEIMAPSQICASVRVCLCLYVFFRWHLIFLNLPTILVPCVLITQHPKNAQSVVAEKDGKIEMPPEAKTWLSGTYKRAYIHVCL